MVSLMLSEDFFMSSIKLKLEFLNISILFSIGVPICKFSLFTLWWWWRGGRLSFSFAIDLLPRVAIVGIKKGFGSSLTMWDFGLMVLNCFPELWCGVNEKPFDGVFEFLWVKKDEVDLSLTLLLNLTCFSWNCLFMADEIVSSLNLRVAVRLTPPFWFFIFVF